MKRGLFRSSTGFGSHAGVIVNGSANTGTRLERNTNIAHGQFNTAKGLHDHDLIEPAKVTDAEHLAVQHAETGTE